MLSWSKDTLSPLQFFIMMPWLIYVANVILGIGAAVIWTAQVIQRFQQQSGLQKKSGHFHFHFLQGNVLANNSDPTTITRNSGVFWAMNMSSNFIGNTLAFLLFKVRSQQNYQHYFSFAIPAKRYHIKKCTYRICDNTTAELNQFSKFLL